MATQEETYKGRRIVIDGEGGNARLTIDGTDIPFVYNPDLDHYQASFHQPYAAHRTLMALARSLVDNVFNLGNG